MRIFAILLCCAPLLVPAAAPAATQLGLRGGWAHASGDLFPGSGSPGGGGLYGVVGSVGILPTIDLELAYERYTKDFKFSQEAYQGTFFNADYEDQAYLLTGKLHLPLIGAPFGFYGGGGASLHKIDLNVDSSNPSFQDYAQGVSDSRNEWEWHLVGGAQFKLPIVPLLAYAEYRYQDVTGKYGPSYSSIYGGLNLYLK